MRKILTLLIVLGMSSLAWAGFKEGTDYEVLERTQPAPVDGKVEVIEFFSYACPHCYKFEPFVEKWKANKSDNVEFINVPAVFNKNWEALASLFYAAEVLGVQEKMHPIIFNSMHGDGKKVRSFDELKEVFKANGVSGEKLEQALTSFTVVAKTRRAKSMTEAYGVKSVPNIVVQGKYRTNGKLANGHKNVFKVVDYLSEKIEKEAQN